MIAFLGGLGLFLLGMHMMTEGLKTAAGHTLRQVLGAWTATRARGLLAGALLTALIQSSSAVTVAVLGFVNAGLLPFSRAMWIVFGSNVGTTATAWIVAAVGMKLQIDAAALPMIGGGMLLATFAPATRKGALGNAIAGFGIFFLGLDILSEAFGGVMDDAALGVVVPGTLLSGFVALIAGVLVTTLVQSSSAAMALALTAAASGALSIADGAAMVIGANLGTTSTAVLGSLGASAAAKRLAGAHVLFNAITAAVALVILPLLLRLVQLVLAEAGQGGDAAVTLALFHTVFNVLGVLLMLPLADRIAELLRVRIPDPAEDAGKPRNLDRSVLAIPDLAVQAVLREVADVTSIAAETCRAALDPGSAPGDAEARATAFAARTRAISEFAVEIQRGSLQPELVERVHRVVETIHRLRAVLADVRAAEGLRAVLPEGLDELEPVVALASEALQIGDPAVDSFSPRQLATGADEVERRFRVARTELVEHASRGDLDAEAASAAITYLGLIRRTVRAMSDAVAVLQPLHEPARLEANPIPTPAA